MSTLQNTINVTKNGVNNSCLIKFAKWIKLTHAGKMKVLSVYNT